MKNSLHSCYHILSCLSYIPAIQCPEGTIYDLCGSPCPPTCGDQQIDCMTDGCYETCRCPDDKVLEGDRCVYPWECGCFLDDGLYLPVSMERFITFCK